MNEPVIDLKYEKPLVMVDDIVRVSDIDLSKSCILIATRFVENDTEISLRNIPNLETDIFVVKYPMIDL